MSKGFVKGFRVLFSGLLLVATASCSVAVAPAAEPQATRPVAVETAAPEAEPVAPTVAPVVAERPEPSARPTHRTLRRLKGSEINTQLVEKAREIVKEHHHEAFGTEIPFELAGKSYVGRIERHYHPEGGPLKPWGYHPGCSLFAVETTS